MSLAAALAVPATRADGSPLQGRDLVLLVTFGVILFTLVVQGLTLPAVVRWARLPDDLRERVEQHLAEETTTRAARAAIDRRAAELGIPHGVVVRVRGQYEQHLEELELRHVDLDGTLVDGDPRALAAVDQERRLRWPCWPTSGAPSCSCAGSGRSTTWCCSGSRRSSTSRRCAWPGGRQE